MRVFVLCQIAFLVLQAGGWRARHQTFAEETPASQPAGDDAAAPPPPRRGPFTLRATDLYTGMELDYQSRRVRSETPYKRDATSHKNRDLRVSELVGLGLAGDVGDPNLFDWRAGLEFGLTQSRFVEEIDAFKQTDNDHGALLEYDFSADALKNKPLSFSGYARRNDDRIGRRFLPSLREIESEAGVSGLAITGPVTTEFGISWRDVERSGNRYEEDDEQLQTSRAYVDSTWQISDHHKLRLSYEHEDQGSNYQGSRYNFDLKRDELRAEHELAFGPGNKHRLDTFIRYNSESGDLARDEVNFVPRLTLQHTDKFRTVYRYGYYQIRQDVIEIEQHKFDVEALYQATRDLRFSLDGFGLYEEADRDVETVQWGTGGDVGYTRPTSTGDLNINLHVAYDREETRGSAGRRVVRNEAHRLSDIRPTFLSKRDVVPISIIAHSDNYTRVYFPGRDYLVIPVADRIQIVRVPWGRIAESDTVFFDYQYDVPAESDAETYWTSFLIEHRFKFGLVPYYSFEGRFQDVNRQSLGTPIFEDNQDRHRLGVRYERPTWTVGTEYEIFDDSIEPFDAVHFTGHAALFRNAAHSLDFRGELSHYWFEGGYDERRVWWLDTDLKDTLQLLEWLSMSTGTAFRWEDDSRDGKTHGVDLEWGLKLNRGYLTVELALEYDLLAIAENREQGFGVFLNVRRDLSHLLPGRSGQ